MLSSLNRINGKKFSISIPLDVEGMMGRECPDENCLGYFKVKPGTGLKGEDLLMTCPYCGYSVTAQDFSTKEQIEYAQSLVLREVEKALGADLRNWGKKLERSTRGGLLKIKTEYKSTPMPIRHYEERELETILTCEECGLVYSVFGKFAYCPDCGVDNTLQILKKNLELVIKLLSKAKDEENNDFQEYLVHNALEDCVSAFDSFGRNSVRLFTKNTEKSDLSISFQNISKAYERILNEFGFDISDGLTPDKWEKVKRNFQKRHLISHNDGIVDDAYIQNTNDQEAALGRQVAICANEVEEMIRHVEIMAKNLQKGLSGWKSEMEKKGNSNA
jgi:hypothetical protein